MPAESELSENALRRHRLNRRLDGWFEPRWRALLTWLAVVALVGLAVDLQVGTAIRKMLAPFFDLLDGMLRAPLPPLARGIATMSNVFALMFWIEPVALRLNLVRSVAWVAVRIVSFMVAFGFAGMNRMIWMGAIMAASAVAALLLRGRRSRPALALLAGILVCVLTPISQKGVPGGLFWSWTVVTSLPYAVVLLYGTRRLSPGREGVGSDASRE